MNLILCYNDSPRYFTVGSYVKKELAGQSDVNILAHCRIPEDTGLCEESCNPNTDLILVVDDGTHYKIHHHNNKIPQKTKSAFWISDLHRSDWAKHRLQMIREFKYDHIFYAQKNFESMIKECGYEDHEITFLPHGVDPDIFKPWNHIEKTCDIGFVGYMNSKREKMFRCLNDYMDSKHFSSSWAWTANRNLNECKILWNCSVESDINMRIFESLATGLPLLTDKIYDNGFEEMFIDGEDLFVYESEDQMKEIAVRLIADSKLRETIGENGRRKVLQFHTYRNRINTILGVMGYPLLENY